MFFLASEVKDDPENEEFQGFIRSIKEDMQKISNYTINHMDKMISISK